MRNDGARVVRDTWSRHVASRGDTKAVRKFIKGFEKSKPKGIEDLLRDLKIGQVGHG